MRLGLFVDAHFRSEGDQVFCESSALAFGRFAAAVGEHFDSFTIIGRGTEDPALAPFPMEESVRLHPLPHYGSLRDLLGVARAVPPTIRALWHALDKVDLVWISASNPIGLILAGLAFLRRRRVAILVRQDSMDYFRRRLPSRRWAPLLAPLWVIDWMYRTLGRRVKTTVVGDEIAETYGAQRHNVLVFIVGLVNSEHVVEAPRDHEWAEPVRLLTVGRIDQEKNPLLLVDVIEELEREDPGRYLATWAGDGAMRDDLIEEASRRGLADRIEAPGFVQFGEPLFALYRRADAFVHTSLTEGVPGVLVEAMSHGLPIVATDVGGIRLQSGDGNAALLVPPDDALALAAAVRRLDRDRRYRRQIAVNGIEYAGYLTLEAQSRRVADFLKED